jgi:glycosyltransferase involved in cell wall biosynthesis
LEKIKFGRPIVTKPNLPKIAFVSPHCVLDFTNGAATATLDGLSLLARLGFDCQAFCSSHMDAYEEVLVEEILARRKMQYVVRNAQIGPFKKRMIFTTHGKVPVMLFNSASTRGGWISQEEVAAFLTASEIFLRRNRPDIVWTYGGNPVSLALQDMVRKLGIPIVFALHNFTYLDASKFMLGDCIVVPSEFAQAYYRTTPGLECGILPYTIDRPRVAVSDRQPRYATFVNPQTTKGLFIFARIAEVLARRRPDIPLLVIEGRSPPGWHSQTGISLKQLPNVTALPSAADPRTFYQVSKLLLVPSLWNESFGLVAAEAMINGIPVLASNRGALPTTVGDAGFLFDIPARYSPDTRELPTTEEVQPWVDTIIRLWDDPAEYDRRSQAARVHAQQWHPARLARIYRDFFANLTRQPNSPFLAKNALY